MNATSTVCNSLWFSDFEVSITQSLPWHNGRIIVLKVLALEKVCRRAFAEMPFQAGVVPDFPVEAPPSCLVAPMPASGSSGGTTTTITTAIGEAPAPAAVPPLSEAAAGSTEAGDAAARNRKLWGDGVFDVVPGGRAPAPGTAMPRTRLLQLKKEEEEERRRQQRFEDGDGSSHGGSGGDDDDDEEEEEEEEKEEANTAFPPAPPLSSQPMSPPQSPASASPRVRESSSLRETGRSLPRPPSLFTRAASFGAGLSMGSRKSSKASLEVAAGGGGPGSSLVKIPEEGSFSALAFCLTACAGLGLVRIK